MSKQVYKMPMLSQLAMRVTDWLPGRVKASLYVDFCESLDDEYSQVHELNDDKSETYHSTISAGRVETLRRRAITEGLKGIRTEVDS